MFLPARLGWRLSIIRPPEVATSGGDGVGERGGCWEDMAVGDIFVTSARTVTEADLVAFITSAGFLEPLFLDARVATTEGPYRGRLVPGALTFVFAEGW